MSPTHLKRFAIVLVAVVVLWGLLALVRRAPNDRASGLALAKVDTAAVDTIRVTVQGDTTTVVRAPARAWRADGLPASAQTVSELLRGLADSSGWSELVAESRTSHERLGVAADSGRRVRVIANGHPVLDLVVGTRANNGGEYVRRPNEDAVYVLHGMLADALLHPADDFFDHRIATIPPDSIATIDVMRGGYSYSLRRAPDKSWAFASGARADSQSVQNVLERYREMNAASVPKPASVATNFKSPMAHVRLADARAKPLAQLSFDSSAAGVLVRADSGGPVFKLDIYALSGLAPAESTLRAKPAPKSK